MLVKLNEVGTPVSEGVHLREFAVIPGGPAEPEWRAVLAGIACRSPTAPI
jgi:hypothetical protein